MHSKFMEGNLYNEKDSQESSGVDTDSEFGYQSNSDEDDDTQYVSGLFEKVRMVLAKNGRIYYVMSRDG